MEKLLQEPESFGVWGGINQPSKQTSDVCMVEESQAMYEGININKFGRPVLDCKNYHHKMTADDTEYSCSLLLSSGHMKFCSP